jgi:hypothetical protein
VIKLKIRQFNKLGGQNAFFGSNPTIFIGYNFVKSPFCYIREFREMLASVIWDEKVLAEDFQNPSLV